MIMKCLGCGYEFNVFVDEQYTDSSKYEISYKCPACGTINILVFPIVEEIH